MKTLILLLMIILALNLKINAEIIYTDINPDTLLITENAQPMYFEIDIDANGTIDFCIAHHESIQFFSAYNGSMALCLNNQYDYSEPCVINKNDSINLNSKDWISHYGSINLTERWDGQSNKYIGLKFKRGTNWHYGWLEISIPQDRSNCIVHGYAYNSSPDEGIKAGEISTTGVWEESISKINIYPNPANEYLNIDNFYQGRIEIYSYIGEKIMESENTDQIDIHNLQSDVYYVKMNNKIYQFIKK